MGTRRQQFRLVQGSLAQGVALVFLLLLGGLAIVGPSGVIAWSENQRLLELRQDQIAELVTERDRLRNRVALLDPNNVDPDLTGELLRSELNVAHPDEMVMLLD